VIPRRLCRSRIFAGVSIHGNALALLSLFTTARTRARNRTWA
jgi:hypothetical protein